MKLLRCIKTLVKKIIYRARNKHNFTQLAENTDISKIEVGNGTYGRINAKTYRGGNIKLKIGNYCSIANETVFLLGGEHNYNNISTYPFKAKYLNKDEAKGKGDIIIKDDVWIGYGSTILSGVTIGQGAIIGAKSVVAKDVPPYAIFAGNKIIKYRFDENTINKLLQIDFSKISEDFIKQNIELLYNEVNEKNIDEIIKRLKKE